MLDPIDSIAPLDGDAVTELASSDGREPAPAAQGRDNRKKKVRVINRKGPSEIDKALRMTQAMREQTRNAGRGGSEKGLSRGTVIRIDKAKGFGFVIDSSGEHRFFHRSAVLNGGFAALKEQQLVEFQPQTDERGARAINVRPAGSAQPGGKPSSSLHPSRGSAPGKTSTWRSDLSPFRGGRGGPGPTGRR